MEESQCTAISLVKFSRRYENSHRVCDFCIVGCSLDADSLDSLLIVIRLFGRIQ